MLFTQIEFFVFFMAVLLYLFVVQNNTLRKFFLLAASYYFYSYWDYRFLSLIIFSTSADYLIGNLLFKTVSQYQRKLLLVISLILNLGLLCLFKYYNFFVSSFHLWLAPIGINLRTLDIILPVGISFYTFQTLSYTIDIYRKTLEPSKSFLDFAVFVSFFPQLVAGPIVRASSFLPQLKKTAKLSKDNFFRGFRLFVMGLFKKVFIADRLAAFVDPVFANADAFNYATVWLAVAAYSIQIYCDFSGYSDMATGLARIMGYELNINFNFPYLAQNITDFWRRWHISLSSWIRDYLYVSLGGNRKGVVRTYANLLFSMLLCGLWHGAAWNFVFWGFYHGTALAVHRIFKQLKSGSHKKESERVFIKTIINRALTILFVMVGWVFFRADGFDNAMIILGKMFWLKSGYTWINPFAFFVVIATALFHIIHALKLWEFVKLPVKAWYTPFALFCMIWLSITFYPKGFQPFIYFQF